MNNAYNRRYMMKPRELRQNILQVHNVILEPKKVTQIKSLNVSYISPKMVHEALERR